MTEIKIGEQKSYQIERKNKELLVNGETVEVDVAPINDRMFHVLLNGKSFRCEVEKSDETGKSLIVKVNGRELPLEIRSELDVQLERMGLSDALAFTASDLKAPMPGMILDLYVQEGDEVDKGDQLLLLEAMKMENVIKAEGAGTVKNIQVAQGDKVEKNALLIEFET